MVMTDAHKRTKQTVEIMATCPWEGRQLHASGDPCTEGADSECCVLIDSLLTIANGCNYASSQFENSRDIDRSATHFPLHHHLHHLHHLLSPSPATSTTPHQPPHQPPHTLLPCPPTPCRPPVQGLTTPWTQTCLLILWSCVTLEAEFL